MLPILKKIFMTYDANIYQTDILNVTRHDNYIQILVLKDCLLEDYCSELERKLPKYIIDKFSFNVIMDDWPNVYEKSIFCFEKDNFLYNIVFNHDKISISEKRKEDLDIIERVFEIDKNSKQYKISCMIHDSNYSTRDVHCYHSNSELNSDYSSFSFDKKKALLEIRELFSNLKKLDVATNIIDIHKLYKDLHIVEDEYYHPVIENDTLALSWSFQSLSDHKNINQNFHEFFDIILKTTMEKVGQISFNYLYDSGFSYSGNVSYEIEKDFQNHHYATMALNLLKDLLKSNEFTGDKDLYVAVLPDNIYSQKVAENNNGVLCYDGKVPEDECIYYIDGIKEVKVYKISI